MLATGRRYRAMKHLSTAFLTIVLAIAVNQGGGVTAEDDSKVDQITEEAKNRAITIIDGPKYVATTPSPPASTKQPDVTPKPEQRPPSKPPLVPDKPKQTLFVDLSRPYYGQMQKIPPPRPYPKHFKLHHSQNSVYKFPRVIPLPHHKNHFYIPKPRPLVIAASTSAPAVAKSPKFSLPVQTINGIRTDFVRPPKINTTTTTSTSTTTETSTTTGTTTTRALRTKRIWPQGVTQYFNTTLHDTTVKNNSTLTNTNTTDQLSSASHHRVRVLSRQTTSATSPQPTPKRRYRPVTRIPKIRSTTPSSTNFTSLEANDWIPIVPSHYPAHSQRTKHAKHAPISKRSYVFLARPQQVLPPKRPNDLSISKRSDVFPDADPSVEPKNQMMYLQSFGLLPVHPTQIAETTPAMMRKKMIYFKRKPHVNPYYSGYSTVKGRSPVSYEPQADLQTEASQTHPRYVTKIKHHHHHHHHKYVKTVEKKVPYKVEVPKPYPVPVEKKVSVPVEKIKYVDKPVPYPVTVEKRVPYPIGIRVPHPVPVRVVEKEYVPKPYPIVHHVPFIKHVQVKVPQPVPYAVEKRVPYPVEVKVPVQVDRPVPVQVTVEKKVPYPVPVKVFVPQPYAVETKVPYRVEVKEPVEVIKHVPIKVPVPQPYAVKVPHPVPVPFEKKVPYPVEVEKKVPVPFEVYVPHRVEVEKRVPVYIPKPYPVEKRVPYPVQVPYPVKVPVQVPVRVPVEVPIYIHGPLVYADDGQYTQYLAYSDGQDVSTSTSVTVTSIPSHTVTVHGNGAYSQQIHSRSDDDSSHSLNTATSSPQS